MTYETAHKILSAHQAFWVLGDLDGLKYTAAEVNEALEFAKAALQSDPDGPDGPDWSQAPEWANYYAIDGDGSRWFYEFEPFQDGLDFNQNKGQWMNDYDSRRMKLFKRPEQ